MRRTIAKSKQKPVRVRERTAARLAGKRDQAAHNVLQRSDPGRKAVFQSIRF
ncbi:MAG: hypothetical protein ACRECP_00140 [Methylocella sp.]